MALEGMERMGREEFRGARPRVYTTDAEHPENGRIFIWTQMGWFERVEGPWGDVAFTPVADDEAQLKDWLAQNQKSDIDLIELGLDNAVGRTVFAEFKDQAEYALYPEAPETSSEEPFEEQDKT